MANSFQSFAKPIISHPEPAQAQVKLAKLEKKDKGHPGADIIYNHTLKNTHRHYSNHPTIHWDSDSISVAHVIHVHVNAIICV